MNIAVVVATFGDRKWERLALERAVPSAEIQGAAEIVAVHREEATLAEARNQGAWKANAEWLCFLDADDELAPNYLLAMEDFYNAGLEEQLRREMQRPLRFTAPTSPALPLPTAPLDLLVPAVQYVRGPNESGLRRNTLPSSPVILDQGRPLYELNWAPIGTLVPRALFLDVGGFRELAALEDWELWLRCERAGAKLSAVPDAVYRAHIRQGSRNSDQRLYREIRGEYERAA